MEYSSESAENAMILPLPVRTPATDASVRFIDLEAYGLFFDDLERGFPVKESWTLARSKSETATASAAAAPELVVHEVGSYVASFVPSIADFARLAPRFRIAPAVWARIPAYADYGFAVFQLKSKEGRPHPMALELESRMPDQIFFPTVHIHDGEVHDREGFDHALYLQSEAFDRVVAPADPATFDGASFALTSDVGSLLDKVMATNTTYTEPALSFMPPPHPTDLSTLKNRGAKMLIYHGTSDPIFSSQGTTEYYEGLRSANGGNAANFARYFRVPGMNHCSGGPSTDQFDLLTPLVDWVEKGQAPDRVTASARGTGNAGGVNADLPAGWAAGRTRPLCPYPKVARYSGSGSLEDAASFTCQ
jgi:hypothetical protein